MVKHFCSILFVIHAIKAILAIIQLLLSLLQVQMTGSYLKEDWTRNFLCANSTLNTSPHRFSNLSVSIKIVVLWLLPKKSIQRLHMKLSKNVHQKTIFETTEKLKTRERHNIFMMKLWLRFSSWTEIFKQVQNFAREKKTIEKKTQRQQWDTLVSLKAFRTNRFFKITESRVSRY